MYVSYKRRKRRRDIYVLCNSPDLFLFYLARKYLLLFQIITKMCLFEEEGRRFQAFHPFPLERINLLQLLLQFSHFGRIQFAGSQNLRKSFLIGNRDLP